MKQYFFLTNDDGVFAPGIIALESYLQTRNIDFCLCAPLHEQSGVGHAISLHSPLRIKKLGSKRFAVEGTPTDAVFLGTHELITEKPHLLISGINRGGNLGNDITYSGTVAAAIEGYYRNITSLAVSLYSEDMSSISEVMFDMAASILFEKIIPFIEQSLGKEELYITPHLININIPAKALDQDNPEIVWTTLGKRLYGEHVIQRCDPRGRDYYWIGGNQTSFKDIPGSDCNAINLDKITLTPLFTDMTDNTVLKSLTR